MDAINTGIECAVLKYPQNIAIVESGQSISYFEMNSLIEHTIHTIDLFRYGQIQDKIVGIYMDSSINAVIAQLAVIRCGGICMPLDRQTPIAYYLLEKYEGIVCLLTDIMDVGDKFCFPTINIIEYRGKLQSEFIMSPDKGCNYLSKYSHCIMTSGTTGSPKAVLLNQKAIINQVEQKIQLLKIDNNSRICLAMGLSFVASIWQIYAAFISGGTLIILDNESRRNPYKIFERADEYNASILCVIPSVLQTYLTLIKNKSRKLKLNNMRNIVLTGETVYTVLTENFYKEYSIQLLNAYGQTECSDDTFHYWIPKDSDEKNQPIVPIGFPIKNIQYAIIDEKGDEVPGNGRGVLWISGICLAERYLNNEKLTKSVFKSIKAFNGNMAFCTGDIMEQRPDNALVCLGRTDNQIKVCGNRIEPETIEILCFSYMGISDAMVIKEQGRLGEYLKLLYIRQEGIDINIDNLRSYLRKRLPGYMIPTMFEEVESILHNGHGKKIRSMDNEY